MNLQESISFNQLQQPPTRTVVPEKRIKLDVAKRVFHLAANGGHPYKYQTPEKWAKKWLTSKDFTLMEIDIHAAASLNINAVASPHKPKNPNRVAHYFQCSVDSLDPIVVDLNKRNVGKSYLGYIPEVIVLDGKHRKMAQLRQGRTKILAWVGCEAAKKLEKLKKVVKVVDAAREDIFLPPVEPTKIATTIELYAATAPSTNLQTTTTRQDAGEGGSRSTMYGKNHVRNKPTKEIKSELEGLLASNDRSNQSASRVRVLAKELKRRYVEGCGARSSGSLEETSASDVTVPPDSSDSSTFVEASDRLKWNPNKPQVNAPGTKGWSSETIGVNPAAVAPGAGVGPRLKPNTGATRSEMSRAVFASKACKCKGKCDKCKKVKLRSIITKGKK